MKRQLRLSVQDIDVALVEESDALARNRLTGEEPRPRLLVSCIAFSMVASEDEATRKIT